MSLQLEGWVPQTERRHDGVNPWAAVALHNLLDAPGAPPAYGEPLPPLWHWLAFLPTDPQGDLGHDGHPPRGRFLPPVGLPRRMWASGTCTFGFGPFVGEPLRRESTVVDVTPKPGRSGDLVFVKVRHRLTAEDHRGGPITELQHLVYREAASPGQAPPADPARDAGPRSWPWQVELRAEPTLLFRFSALTYNAHRIHYDLDYARRDEGYPGLVVHGPLQAIALAELSRRFAPQRKVHTFSFRGLTPAFGDQVLTFCGRPTSTGGAELVALSATDVVTMTAEATFATDVGPLE